MSSDARGFFKKAARQKFVRHRDIKLKDKEERKEEQIQRLMCEGVCDRCREKVQWRFQFDKYKPLKHLASCQECKNKTVTKAYRLLCDNCGSKLKCCAACKTTDFHNSFAKAKSEEEVQITAKPPVTSLFAKKVTVEQNEDDSEDESEEESDEESEEESEEESDEESEENSEEEETEKGAVITNKPAKQTQSVKIHALPQPKQQILEADKQEEGEDSDADAESVDEGLDEELGNGGEMEKFNEMHTVFTSAIADASASSSMSTSGGVVKWDEKKFMKIATSKYSKDRKVGEE